MSLPNFSTLRQNFALRLQRQKTGTARFSGESNDRAGASLDAQGLSQVHAGSVSAPIMGENYDEYQDLGPIALNDDVWRKRFVKYHRTRLIRLFKRAWAFIADLQSDKFSMDEKLWMIQNMRHWEPDELEEHRRKTDEKHLLRFHIDQAKVIKPQIVETLTRLGFCYAVTKNERKIIKRKVFIGHVDVTPYAYTFYVSRVPFGVKTTDMAQDWVATELAVTLKRKVRHALDQVLGLRYTIEIGATLSIPNFVEFKSIEKMPKNLPPLAFWAGSTTNGNAVYRNLADAPHMIIAGSTGGGKSNYLNAIIATLLMRNRPDEVKMVFFDLKGGVEFGAFDGIPHLWNAGDKCDGIIEFPDQVIPALEAIFAECNARLDKMKKAKGIYKNIGEFNRGKHPRNRIPFLVIFFDEWATTRKLVGERAETLVSNIANLARATGIHFVLATQYPKAEIINTMISVNFPWRIAFGMSQAASQSVLGNWNAFGLSPVGRAIFQTSGNEIQIQTPRITNSTLTAIINAVKSGGIVAEMASVDAEELLEWALLNTGGKLDHDTLFNQFREKISQAALRDLLKSMDDQTFEIQGTLYTVINKGGNAGRRMELTEQEQDRRQPAMATGNAQHAKPLAVIPAPDDPLLGPCPFCAGPRKHNPCEFCGQATEEG